MYFEKITKIVENTIKRYVFKKAENVHSKHADIL